MVGKDLLKDLGIWKIEKRVDVIGVRSIFIARRGICGTYLLGIPPELNPYQRRPPYMGCTKFLISQYLGGGQESQRQQASGRLG